MRHFAVAERIGAREGQRLNGREKMVGKRSIRYKEQQNLRLIQGQATCHCPLCGRPLVPGPSVDEHHLIPKSKGGRDKFAMHKVCHQKIHSLLNESELARHYNTWEALKIHPEIQKFIRWVSKRPPEYLDRNRRPSRG